MLTVFAVRPCCAVSRSTYHWPFIRYNRPSCVQTLDKFFSFEVEVVDDTKRYRYIEVRYDSRTVQDAPTARRI